jgi:hypothetical protein
MMSPSRITSVVGIHAQRATTISAASIAPISYVDTFTLSTPHALSAPPTSWALAIFGATPSRVQKFLWHSLLGFSLTNGASPATVAGWKITGKGDDWVRMEQGSWYLKANLVVMRADGRVHLSTFLKYENLLGRTVWTLLAGVHRLLVPGILRSGERRIMLGK